MGSNTGEEEGNGGEGGEEGGGEGGERGQESCQSRCEGGEGSSQVCEEGGEGSGHVCEEGGDGSGTDKYNDIEKEKSRRMAVLRNAQGSIRRRASRRSQRRCRYRNFVHREETGSW